MKAKEQPVRELIRLAIIFRLLIASIVGLWRNSTLLLCLVLGESALALLLWHGREDVAIVAASGLFGSLAEVVFVHGGVWSYTNPGLLGVPIWFPPAFATAALCGHRLAGTITALWMNKQRRAAG
jgi:uncharacterized membrane protein YoaT (DUF817 family)